MGAHARRAVLLALALVGTVTPSAAGADPVRYRDEVFGSVKITKDLQYGQAVNYEGDLQRLLLDVHEPAGDTAPLRAAVVWVHGGYFKRGSKESPSYAPAVAQFAKAGFVTFAINYRLQGEGFPEGVGPAVSDARIQEYIDAILDAQHDAQAAVRWVRANARKYKVNPDQVAIVGHSAGGITAQQVNYNDHDPGNSGNPGYSSRVNAAVSSAGSGMPGLTTRVDVMEPPLLQTHGLVDNVVPFTPFNCLNAVALGNTCELVLDPDNDHSMFGFEYWREFLYRQMINKPVGLRPTTNVTLTGFPS